MKNLSSQSGPRTDLFYTPVLILCGFFCAGKTTLGKKWSEHLSLPFYDTDRMIEAAYGKGTVSSIWKEIGLEAFRDLESEVICSLKKHPAVVATGGGSLLREENRNYLKSLGPLFYLKVPLPILLERMKKKGFPAYLDQENPYAHFEKLAKERFPIYNAHCQYILETS